MPDLTVVDDLLAYAQSEKGAWPLRRERELLERLNTWAAILDSDGPVLAKVAGWTDPRRRYRVDPLGERIADSWAHYLFGEDPHVTPANDGDADLLEAMLGTDFPSELERGGAMCVGEGEIWARTYVDPIVAPRPLLDWVSRRSILPLWAGIRLAAAAIITEHATSDDHGDGGKVIYRHFEIHAPGLVANRLFLGKADKLGRLVDLEAHPATATLEPDWPHGLPGMLIERIPNKLRGDRRIGVSDYKGILDPLLDLNEAAVIGAHNMKLTARKRAIVSASALAQSPRGDLALTPEENLAGGNVPRARFDASEEVFVEDPLDGELGKSSNPFRILEYGFDADPLIKWTLHLVGTSLSRVGLTAQYAGASDDSAVGYAISGTALRMRLIPTDKTGRGKGRYWDDALPRILANMAQLDALADTAGGFARAWADPRTPPTVERQPGIPVDPVEDAQVHGARVNAGIESRYTAIRSMHPDWTDTDVTEELDRIRAEAPSAGPGSMHSGF